MDGSNNMETDNWTYLQRLITEQYWTLSNNRHVDKTASRCSFWDIGQSESPPNFSPNSELKLTSHVNRTLIVTVTFSTAQWLFILFYSLLFIFGKRVYLLHDKNNTAVLKPNLGLVCHQLHKSSAWPSSEPHTSLLADCNYIKYKGL